MTESEFETAVRVEARDWVTRLKDVNSAADRKCFDDWIAQDPAHRRAYEEVSAAYQASSVLRASNIGRRRDLGSVFPPRPSGMRGFAIASIAALFVVGAFELSGSGLLRPVALESVMLSTGMESKDVILADGSKVSMAPSSEVRIDLNPARRLAEVRKGHVRLTIKSENRAFVIVAGMSSVQAESGVFDAQVIGNSGTIDAAGEKQNGRAAISARDEGEATTSLELQRGRTIEFKAERLEQAIGRINALNAGPPLELDPKLAELRVTGVFQHGNSEALARSLALAFNLKVANTPSGALRLHR